MKYKIPKFSRLCLVSSQMQNLLLSLEPLEAFLYFLASLFQNLKWRIDTFLPKKFAWHLVSLCKMIELNSKLFGINGELNTPLIMFG
jgi:hypothetical protein